MSARRFAIIDPAVGISGDMVLGALIELGAPRSWLTGLPRRLGVPEAAVAITPATRCGVSATRVTVRLRGAIEGPGDVPDPTGLADSRASSCGPEGEREHEHAGGFHHRHRHEGPHRHVGELLAMIDAAPLSDWVKARAGQALRFLAEAEARVHGVASDEVALHEVGAHDALVDIVGAVEGFEQLGIERVVAGPVAVGSGWVRAAHGVLPVPAPATALLLEGLEIAPNGPVVGEATTPTGAALLRALAPGPRPRRWRATRVGWGAGARDPSHYPNVLKVTLAEPVESDEEIVVVATDLDDLSPEYLEPLRDALVQAGALDVQSWATQMKKGRIGFRVEALASRAGLDAVVQAFFRHSSTAGLRWWPVTRATLAREQWELVGDDGARVRVKTLHGPDGPRVKPEYDDVVAEARRTGQPAHEVSRRLQEEALRRVHAARGADAGADNVQQKE